MTLVEVTILGSLRRPQGFHKLYDAEKDSTCFAGAVLDGLGISLTDHHPNRAVAVAATYIRAIYPWMTQKYVSVCPECDGMKIQLKFSPLELGYHLNDRHRWDRVRIARYLQVTYQPQQAETTQPELEVSHASQ